MSLSTDTVLIRAATRNYIAIPRTAFVIIVSKYKTQINVRNVFKKEREEGKK
jgi:hypothetical protein